MKKSLTSRTIEVNISKSNLAAALEQQLHQFSVLNNDEHLHRVGISQSLKETPDTVGLTLTFTKDKGVDLQLLK